VGSEVEEDWLGLIGWVQRADRDVVEGDCLVSHEHEFVDDVPQLCRQIEEISHDCYVELGRL